MPERPPNYVLVALMLLVSTGITYWARTRPPLTPTDADLASLPIHIGEWSRAGTDWAPGKDVLDGWGVNSSDFLTRTYTNRNGASMSLMVVYKGLDRRRWHLSEMCFSGSGYNVTQSLIEAPYAGRNACAVKLVAVNPTEGCRYVAVYLFAQEHRTESNFVKQQLAMARSRLSPPEYGWAFVRVMSPVTISEEDTTRQIREFLRTASGPLVTALANPPQRVALR